VLSHTPVAGYTIRRVVANDALSAVAYIIGNVSNDFELYAAGTQPVITGQLISSIQFDAITGTPEISAITKDGSEVLISTVVNVSGGSQRLLEIGLTPGALPATIQTEPPGFNVYTYVDDSQSIAFTSNPGVSTLLRGQSPSAAVNYYPSQKVAAYEFAPDGQTIAVINTDNSGTASSHLFLVNRDTRTTPLQITGLTNASSQTTAVRIVPVN